MPDRAISEAGSRSWRRDSCARRVRDLLCATPSPGPPPRPYEVKRNLLQAGCGESIVTAGTWCASGGRRVRDSAERVFALSAGFPATSDEANQVGGGCLTLGTSQSRHLAACCRAGPAAGSGLRACLARAEALAVRRVQDHARRSALVRRRPSTADRSGPCGPACRGRPAVGKGLGTDGIAPSSRGARIAPHPLPRVIWRATGEPPAQIAGRERQCQPGSRTGPALTALWNTRQPPSKAGHTAGLLAPKRRSSRPAEPRIYLMCGYCN